jgi:hypothetical protein
VAELRRGLAEVGGLRALEPLNAVLELTETALWGQIALALLVRAARAHRGRAAASLHAA